MSPVLLHAVGIDHVRAPETIALAISRPEPVMSPSSERSDSWDSRPLSSDLLSWLAAI